MQPSVSALASAALAAGSLVLLAARPAAADIKQPDAHPHYHFEAEPHFMFGVRPPGPTAGQGFGPGFRGTVVLLDNGLVSSINDSVGLGFGFDWIAFPQSKKKTSIWVPIVMQWNFWLSDHWSVFAEPGFGFYLGNATGIRADGAGGVRLNFNQTIALTLRAGYPVSSIGLSFLL